MQIEEKSGTMQVEEKEKDETWWSDYSAGKVVV
jgi:hypothetical protein